MWSHIRKVHVCLGEGVAVCSKQADKQPLWISFEWRFWCCAFQCHMPSPVCKQHLFVIPLNTSFSPWCVQIVCMEFAYFYEWCMFCLVTVHVLLWPAFCSTATVWRVPVFFLFFFNVLFLYFVCVCLCVWLCVWLCVCVCVCVCVWLYEFPVQHSFIYYS